MDPNQTWSDLSRAIERDDWDEATDLGEALVDWIERGGFPPTITGIQAFDRIVTAATAQAVAAWETV
jgi:hypothetical protein